MLDGAEVLVEEEEEAVEVGALADPISSTSSGASYNSFPSLAIVHPNAVPSLLTAFPRTKLSNCASERSIVVSNPVLLATVTLVQVRESLALAVHTTQLSTSVAPFQEKNAVFPS